MSWNILGIKFFEDTWVDYGKGSLNVLQRGDIFHYVGHQEDIL